MNLRRADPDSFFDDIERDRSAQQQTSAKINALPELVINQSDPTATARELAMLFAQHDDFLFNGYTPVRIAVEADNLPRALEVTNEAIRVYAHKLCRPVKERKVKGNVVLVAVPLSRDIASIYLNGLEGEWGLRGFRGITTAPILSDDGNIRFACGLDHDTGLWCHNVPDLIIPKQPTTDEADFALHSLRTFFRTFPFADSARVFEPDLDVEVTDLGKPIGLDESTFLVALLTSVCRQSLELAPGVLLRAPSYSGAGTGKGLLVKAICIVASGASPSAFTSGHDSEEFDKRLTSALIEARPAVFLDNFNAKELKSDILASALTEYPAMVRPMGQTKMVPLHTCTLITITGNAIEIAEDMARRLIVINLDARMENPELRKFAPGFLDHVYASRPQLLTNALTIWRWGRQNRFDAGKPFGSFELWASWCRDPLLELGCRDPIDRLAEIKAADPRRRMLVALFDAWWTCHADATMKAADIADEVTAFMSQRRDDTGRASRQVIATFLMKHANTRVGGYFLSQTKDPNRSRPIAYYTLHKEEQK